MLVIEIKSVTGAAQKAVLRGDFAELAVAAEPELIRKTKEDEDEAAGETPKEG